MPSPSEGTTRPPTLLGLPSYLAGSVARIGNGRLVLALKAHGLSIQQFAVLVALSDFGTLAPHELSTRLATDRSHISTYIEALARRALVERELDPADRRRLRVTFTEQGRQLTKELIDIANASQTSFLSMLSDSERDTLRTLMLKIIHTQDGNSPPGENC